MSTPTTAAVLLDADGKPVGDRRVVDAVGEAFIPASRRKDGTWRKEIKVRPGYIPPDEVAAYVPRAARESVTKPSGIPVGMDPARAAPVVKGRGATSASKPVVPEADTAAARKNARRREKRAEERLAAEEKKLAERLAAVALEPGLGPIP